MSDETSSAPADREAPAPAAVRAGIHSLGHFALNVPSIAEAERFFGAFGLDVQPAGARGDERELRAADHHRWGRILPSHRKSLAYLSFHCFADDLAAIGRQVRDAGAVFDGDPALTTSEGLWFRDPDGNLVQVTIGPRTSPRAKAAPVHRGAPADQRGACVRSAVVTVRPRRLSHVLLFTPDVARAMAFYQRSIGLRLSDHSGDVIAFLRSPHGGDHHLVAFARSQAKGWHHVAWDVEAIDDVGCGAAQMAAAGFTQGWGTGRHVLGSNYFHYVRDPWGSFSEYSAEIDYVSAASTWPTGDFSPEDSLYLWGPDVPDYFLLNTEAR